MPIHSFLKKIRKHQLNPGVILDLGANIGNESVILATQFPKAQIYSFECNPVAIEKCKEKTSTCSNIQVIPKAVQSSYKKEIDFYSVVGSHPASSLFLTNGEYEKDQGKARFVQQKIKVDSTRIDIWANENGIDHIDLVWMDLQGAELDALIGFGDLIKTVKMIYVEVQYKPIYKGSATNEAIDKFLLDNGFVNVWYDKKRLKLSKNWWTDKIYMAKR